MKRIIAVTLIITASVLAVEAEIKTVEGILERSESGVHTFVLTRSNLVVLDDVVYTAYDIQDKFEKYEGKRVRITGDYIIRFRGDTVIKRVDSIEEVSP